MTVYTHLPSPVGDLLVTAEGEGITGLYYPEHRRGPEIDAAWQRDDGAFAELRAELADYFAGRRTRFDVALDPRGSAFQQAVWQALRDIPYGTTTTYGALADALGRPTAVRAVAGAVARNPLSIVVPCHRVIGASGALTGYAGGTTRKQHLLRLEGVLPVAGS